MAAITSSVGLGSGIDINGTVAQLTTAEGRPQLDAIAAKSRISQTKLSGLGTLKGALSAFQNSVKVLDKSSAFEAQQISSSDEKVLKISAIPGSTASSHTVKVNTLAKAQKSVSSIEFKSTDVVKEGVLIVNNSSGEPRFSVIVEKGKNDSLVGLRDAINAAKGNNSVVASVLNVDSKTSLGTTVTKLVLMAKTEGTANTFSIDASLGDTRFNLDNVATPANYQTIDATDANVIIDATPVPATPQRSVAAKEFSDTDVVLPGVLSFKDVAGNEKFSVTITKGSNDRIFAAMDAVNNAVGNTIVVASVVNVDSKINPGKTVSKLVFTAKKPGLENKFSIDASKGDSSFVLDSSPVNAQSSVAVTNFASENDKITAGTLTFKDATGATKFAVEMIADKTVTTDASGTVLPLAEDGSPIIPTGADGLPVAVITETTKGNNTLAQLRDAINFAPENKLVIASLVATVTPAVAATETTEAIPEKSVLKLVLTALGSGTEKGFTIDATAGDTRFNLDSKAPTTNFTTTTTAATFDTTLATDVGEGGQVITRTSNSISDAIPGVTLTLQAAGTSNVDARLDKVAITTPISSFVDAYNKLSDVLKLLTNYVEPGSANNGPLLGDTTVQTITSQIKQIINGKVSSATGDYNSLTQLGITFDKKGVMSLDSSKLDAAIAGNLTSVGNVFASKEGVASLLNTRITQYLDPKGALSTTQDTLNKTLKQLTTEKTAVEKRLETTKKNLQDQFIAMDTAVSQFKSTGTFLTQALTPKTTTA